MLIYDLFSSPHNNDCSIFGHTSILLFAPPFVPRYFWCVRLQYQLSKKAVQRVRLENVEEGVADTTRTPSMDSLATEVAGDSADSSVTVLGMDDIEVHAGGEGEKRVK